ncbi:hypothetical protein V8D89_002726 [Ganoderma adspersum]
MDGRLKNRRRVRLGPRDSVSSASLPPAPTGTASQLNSSSGLAPDALQPFHTKPHIPKMPQMDKNGGGDSGSDDDDDDDDNSKNNGSNNGSKSSSDPSSPSGLPNGCSVNNIRPMPKGCFFLNENDGSLHYSDGWSFSTSDPNGLIHTVHFTQTPESSVSLMFNASNIIVFGLVPSGSSPPQASYSIDGLSATSPHMAATTQCVPNQQLFNSGNLAAGLHNLTIDVTMASQSQPYIVDYLWLCGAGTDASESSTAATETHSKTSKDGVIVGVVLGTLALLLAIAICVWMFVRRRRKRLARMRKLHLSPSPVASWLYWNSQSDERQSMFTSSEDILANNPTYSSSSGTQKGMSYRKAPPPFFISAPPTVRMSAVSKATSLSRPASYDPPGLEDTGWYPRRMERAPSVVQE